MSTPVAKKEDLQKDWFVVDLEDKVLGRAATEIAKVLRGKHKAIFTPSVDTGDFRSSRGHCGGRAYTLSDYGNTACNRNRC